MKHATGAGASDLRDPVLCLALGFGTGLVPRAPGTAGSVLGLGLAVGLAAGGAGIPLYLGVTLALVALGVPICAYAGRRLGQHDHPAIVWDELASFPLVLLGLPAEPAWLLAGFVLFRLLDALKPWPIGWLDRRVAGGAGVMADDVAAALAACALLHAVRLLLG